MDARQERGLQIAQNSKIVKTPVGWKVLWRGSIADLGRSAVIDSNWPVHYNFNKNRMQLRLLTS